MKVIFSDFDGTLTVNHQLSAIFFDILDLVKKQDSRLVIVSGRSISWGHFFLTHFDIPFALMEGGGVLLYKNREGHICEETLVYDEDIEDLKNITSKILKDFPGIKLSADSFGRKTDRAIELYDLDKTQMPKLEKLLVDNKINYSKSNVHLNYWVGDVSKFKAVKHLLKHYLPHVNIEETLFYGDARNDESMFEHHPNTIGVSNIISILDQLKFKPRIILEGKDNAGANGVYQHLKQIFESSIDF